MIKCLTILIGLNFSIFAFDVVEFRDLYGNWNGATGDFSALELKLSNDDIGLTSRQFNIPIRKSNDRYFINYKDLELNYKPVQNSIINGISSLSIDNATLVYHRNKVLQLKTNGIEVAQEQGVQKIPQLILRCRNLLVDTSDIKMKVSNEELLTPCLQATTLKIPELILNEFSAQKFKKAMDDKISVDKLEEIHLNVYKESFELTFKARFLFNWTIKMLGDVTYDTEKGHIDFYLKSAKAGFFNIKGTLLKQIADANLDSIKVVGDHLIVTL